MNNLTHSSFSALWLLLPQGPNAIVCEKSASISGPSSRLSFAGISFTQPKVKPNGSLNSGVHDRQQFLLIQFSQQSPSQSPSPAKRGHSSHSSVQSAAPRARKWQDKGYMYLNAVRMTKLMPHLHHTCRMTCGSVCSSHSPNNPLRSPLARPKVDTFRDIRPCKRLLLLVVVDKQTPFWFSFGLRRN